MVEKKKIIWKRWYMFVLYCFVGLMILGVILPDTDTSNNSNTGNINTNDNSKSESSSNIISVGEEGRLYVDSETIAPVCTTRDYIEELVDTAVAKDSIGYEQMLRSGNCYLASTLDDLDGDYYGRVLVLEHTWNGLTKFRFVHPDALHYAETAWTNTEFIISLN
jgi:hypothetical protein